MKIGHQTHDKNIIWFSNARTRGVQNWTNNYFDEIKKTQKIHVQNTRDLGRRTESLMTRGIKYFLEYCEQTSLHGVRYIVEKGRPLCERVCWMVVFFISIILCSYLINNVWTKWSNNPMIITFADSSKPIWEIPFPAVTICGDNPYRTDQFNFSHALMMYDNLSAEERDTFHVVSLLCPQSDYVNSMKGPMLLNRTALHILKSLAPRLEDELIHCTLFNVQVNCSVLFTRIWTSLGLCYTVNMLNRTELFTKAMTVPDLSDSNIPTVGWVFGNGFKAEGRSLTYPFRAYSRGRSAGLRVRLQSNEADVDYSCRGPVRGFKILLHAAVDYPRLTYKHYLVGKEELLVISVKPQVMLTSPSLKKYSPEVRQCYFADERRLKYFNMYSQLNCEIECLNSYLYKSCNCIRHYAAHAIETPVCGFGSRKCMKEAEYRLYKMTMEYSLAKRNGSQDIVRKLSEDYGCNCLPSCTTIDYNGEISQAEYQWNTMADSDGQSPDDREGKHYSEVLVFFNQNEFFPIRRNELYGITDFIANCGGLLGLFLGFSFLSLFEMVYFFTLRLGSNIIVNRLKLKNKIKMQV